MSVNCIRCVRRKRTGPDLLCDVCRARDDAEDLEARHAILREQLNAPDIHPDDAREIVEYLEERSAGE